MIVAGADGCRGGWIVVTTRLDGPGATMAVVARFADIVDHPARPSIIAVDMPIGLPARIGPGGRGPERALRPLLGGRQSSVFAVPSRAAVEAPSYAEACALAAATSDPPRRVSKQAFFLFPKIREVDAFLRARPEQRERVYECHPEGAFRVMKGAPLTEPKKARSVLHEPGLRERRALLLAAGFPPALLDGPCPAGARRDDLYDACATAWTARRVARGEALAFPADYGCDAYGLRVAIFA